MKTNNNKIIVDPAYWQLTPSRPWAQHFPISSCCIFNTTLGGEHITYFCRWQKGGSENFNGLTSTHTDGKWQNQDSYSVLPETQNCSESVVSWIRTPGKCTSSAIHTSPEEPEKTETTGFVLGDTESEHSDVSQEILRGATAQHRLYNNPWAVASGPITSGQIEGGKNGNCGRFYFLWLQNHCRQWLQPWN